MVSKELKLAVRGLEILWTVLIVALVGNMIATASKGNPSIVNYDMFAAVFSGLSLIYLTVTTWKEDWGMPLITLALDFLNVIFLFCGAVATAAYLGVHSCSNEDYRKNNFITNGSPDMGKRCHEAQASTAFLWFNLAFFVASCFVSFMENNRGGVDLRGGVRRNIGTPAMSQV